MKIFVVSKWGQTARWAEDVVEDLRLSGHSVWTFSARDPRISLSLQRLLLSPAIGAPLAVRIERATRKLMPDIILGIGAYNEISTLIFQHLAGIKNRPHLVAWIGDLFTASERATASLFDLVAYTDTGFLDLHDRLDFRTQCLFVPLAANRSRRSPALDASERLMRLAFVAAPTANRVELLSKTTDCVDVYGQGWERAKGLIGHAIDGRRIGPGELDQIYAEHVCVLNVRNSDNVYNGMNQRHFAPYLFGTPVLSDAQVDIEQALAPGSEIMIYDDHDHLNEIFRDVRRQPTWAMSVGAAGRHRILAEHTYHHRLETVREALGL